VKGSVYRGRVEREVGGEGWRLNLDGYRRRETRRGGLLVRVRVRERGEESSSLIDGAIGPKRRQRRGREEDQLAALFFSISVSTPEDICSFSLTTVFIFLLPITRHGLSGKIFLANPSQYRTERKLKKATAREEEDRSDRREDEAVEEEGVGSLGGGESRRDERWHGWKEGRGLRGERRTRLDREGKSRLEGAGRRDPPREKEI
jgi:hypothetical protein